MAGGNVEVRKVTAGQIVQTSHPVTGVPVQRTVAKVTNHPELGVIVWYTSGPPDYHKPGDTVPVVS
jgi:hypothetical protein